MPFGKYEGRYLEDLPNGYLDWLYSLDDLREPLCSEVEEEWNRRHFARERQAEEPKQSTGRMACPDKSMVDQLITAGVRALALRHHPDRGGDLETMKRINCCADWLRDRMRSLFQ